MEYRAILKGNINQEEWKELNKKVKKETTKDKRTALLKEVDESLDVRDQWLGIKRMKNNYKPKVYALRGEGGKMANGMKSRDISGIFPKRAVGKEGPENAGTGKGKRNTE